MEPIKRKLANFSEDINDRFHKMDPDRSVASYALRWVGSHPNVKVILSGMSTMDQVEDNLKTFQDFSPLSEAEEKEIESIVTELRSRVQNGCTGCRTACRALQASTFRATSRFGTIITCTVHMIM